MKQDDIQHLVTLRNDLIEKFNKCRDYKYDKNALMKEVDYVAVLNKTIKKIDDILRNHVNFS